MTMLGDKDSTKSCGRQHYEFVRKARELEVDEDEAAFEENLKRFAKAKPKKEAPT